MLPRPEGNFLINKSKIMAPIAAAAIAAGASALSTGGQIYAAGKMNKKTREWNEKMYGIQREDALRDWNMQNAYNSPEAQMQRFKAAGLNPNLIYGQQNESAAVRSTDVKGWNPQTPDIQTGARHAISSFADYTLQSEQIKNMEASRKSIEADLLLKQISAANMATQGKGMEFDLGQRIRLADTLFDQANATLEQTRTGTSATSISTYIAQNRDAREAVMQSSNLKEAAERILNAQLGRSLTIAQMQRISAEIKNLGVQNRLLNADAALREKGIMPGDPAWLRMGSQIIGTELQKVEGLPTWEQLKEGGKKLLNKFNPFSWKDEK